MSAILPSCRILFTNGMNRKFSSRTNTGDVLCYVTAQLRGGQNNANTCGSSVLLSTSFKVKHLQILLSLTLCWQTIKVGKQRWSNIPKTQPKYLIYLKPGLCCHRTGWMVKIRVIKDKIFRVDI